MVTLRLAAVRKFNSPQLARGPNLGCHGHGFAWPCLRTGKCTATQSRDRGTLKTSVFFPDSLLGRETAP